MKNKIIDIEKISNEIIKKIGTTPISIHMDLIGLYKLGKTNKERLENFRNILLLVEQKGGTVLIPVYSMSYTKKELYDIKNSPSDVGQVTDYLRELDYDKRTTDPNFSYLVYSKNDYSNHIDHISDYESFGKSGLIADICKKNGFLGTIGCGVRMLTEIYFVENKLGVPYRYNKEFKGTTKSLSGEKRDTSSIYFCRNIDSYPNLVSNFMDLQEDIKKTGLIQEWNIDNKLLIHLLRFDTLEYFIREKIEKNTFYLTIDKELKLKVDK